LQKRGGELSQRAWQQIGRKLERDTRPQESGTRSLAGDRGEHPVVLSNEGARLA
jgi:hypothetical protein